MQGISPSLLGWFCSHLNSNFHFCTPYLSIRSAFWWVFCLGFAGLFWGFLPFWSSLSTLTRAFVSEGCAWGCSWWNKSFTCDSMFCTWCAVVWVFYVQSNRKEDQIENICLSHKLAYCLYSESEGFCWLLNMPSEFQQHSTFKWCLNCPAITIAVFPTVTAALC